MSFTYEAYDEFFKDLARHTNTNIEIMSLEQIDALEKRINRHIPVSIRAYLTQIGTVLSNYANDHYEFDIEGTIDVIVSGKKWDFDPYSCIDIDDLSILPIMARHGVEEIFFVMATEDDPPVYWFHEEAESYRFTIKHYTLFVRESFIGQIDFYRRNTEVIRRIHINGSDKVASNREVYLQIIEETRQLRSEFVAKIYEEDESRGRFTLIPELQKRWVEEFSDTNLWKELQSRKFTKVPYAVFTDSNP